MLKAFIGAAGTTTAFGVVRTLKSRWRDRVEVIAADINPRALVATAAIADGFVQSPPVAADSYPEWLVETLASASASLYMPLIDEDIAIASRLGQEGGLGETMVAAPGADSARVCWDKLATDRWLREHGLPSPGTWTPAEAPRDGRELIAKSRYGQGSAGFQVLGGPAPVGEDTVVQERCAGPEVTIDTFLAGDGSRFRALCRERLEVKAGVCVKARVFEDGELAELAEAVVAGLGLTPASCIQVMKGPEGWAVTDVNARPGAGARLSTAAGVDLLAAACADLLDLPLDREAVLEPLAKEVFVVRQFDEFVVD